MTVVDPATFTGGAVLRTYWQAYAGNIDRYDCQADAQRADGSFIESPGVRD
jgi:hypothetical protein